MNPLYNASVPPVQCGAVPSRGTDLANHYLRSFIHYARLNGKSVAIVFVDLVKAFDRIIRELALGWSHCRVENRLDHLASLGLSKTRAQEVIEMVDRDGCIFKRQGLKPRILELVNSLHSGSWFKVGNECKGCRQGCRFGGKLFNLIYADALVEVNAILKKA